MRHPLRMAGGAALLALALTACGSDTKQMLGLERSPPDEFAVVSRAPLSVPPEFSLRPPEPGAPRPQEGRASDQARRALTGAEMQAAYRRAGLSPGEATLLARTAPPMCPMTFAPP